MASTCAQVGGLSRPWRSTDEFRSITISEPRINDRIRVPEVRLIGPGGEQVGVVATGVALKLAQDADLDLVEVAPDARPPVAKLMDYGKFKYESDMKAREARRNQANTVLKEIRFRLKIDPHDYGTKKGHVVRFLEAGDKVKVMIMFRGREQSRPEMGVRLLQRLAEDVSDLGFVESMPKQDGRNMTMVLGPVKKKADAKVEQRKRSSEINAQRKTKSEVKAEARAQAAPAQPTPEPEPTEPEVEAQEAPAPEAAQPAPAPRAETKPAETKPAETKPAETKPAAAPAAASKPATSKPATSKPATSKPAAASKPASAPAKPAAAPKPATPAKPAAATPKPATPKPATPRPPAPRPKPSPRAGR
ncbi:translation initiation factor IF-3 [Isoptericola sp. NPDC056134]|uniref:translation initiation factor IF-3 n=1 Tax=Isoptericola sp. NPDC056134 TaxID=3345723 RepID=UPI0035EEAB88